MARLRAMTGQGAAAVEDWLMALSPPGACAGPAEAAALTGWIPARAPGTAAQALAAAGLWRPEAPTPLHEHDVWWRATLPPGGAGQLCFEGLATIAEAWLDETPLFSSRSMYAPQAVRLPDGATGSLWICFRALKPALAAKAPRARWRPFMITEPGLRLARTTVLGHVPGWRPRLDVVGPWRPVWRIEDAAVRLRAVSLKPSVGRSGPELAVSLQLEGAEAAPVVACAGAEVELQGAGDGRFEGVLKAPAAALWRPHTHGEPALHAVTARVGDVTLDLGRTGFRTLEVDRDSDGQGWGLRINGEPVFCRGAAWVNPDVLGLGGARNDYEPALRRMAEAGMNMVRIAGVGTYESPAFYELCDELGLMVWQDFMFANFDYPAQDPAFVAAVMAEAEALLDAVEASPSLAVLCGGSEVMQQAAMMGLPTDMRWPLFDEVLPAVAARLRPDVPYVPNSPWGGPLPFVADQGVTHYYGVGAYERPLADARHARVRFASECLAFANVPEAESLKGVLDAPAVHDPRWKARAPRDRGASWDFEDVRDHYFQRLFGLDPYRTRREASELYLDLSRAVSGEVMAAVFAEWRRPASSCRGGLVWLLQDAEIGAGWGLIDAAGRPKPAWWALRRVLQPVQALLTDEGVNGLAVHLLNETASPVQAELRLSVWAETPGALIDRRLPVALAAREARTVSAFELLGRFFDLSCAYRFGPRQHAAVSAQLLAADGRLLSQAVHAPADARGWEAAEIAATVEAGEGGWTLTLSADRLVRFVKIADPSFEPEDDWLVLLPGEPRRLKLRPRPAAPPGARPAGELRLPGGVLAGSYEAG